MGGNREEMLKLSQASGNHAMDISHILIQHTKGCSKEYNLFVNQLRNPGIESEHLAKYLAGLRDGVNILDKDFEHLVGVLLQINWSTKEPAVVKEYQSLVLNLISAHTFYLRACVRMLVKSFMPPKSEQEDVSESTKKQHYYGFANLHLLLKAIAQIVPMTPTILVPLIEQCFPYLSKSTYTQECYTRNILATTEYVPSMRRQVLEIAIDRMLKLDVRAPRQEIEDAGMSSDEEEEDMDTLFQMDDMPALGRVSPTPVAGEGGAMSHQDADRLDVMMDVILNFITSVSYKNGALDWESTKKCYRELLLIFEKIILSTHGSCHVQFIMFYICSFRQELCVGFLDYLWKKVQDPNSAFIIRQAAVAYIASLLARAKFVPISTVVQTVEMMMSWIHSYIKQASPDSAVDVHRHGPFYSVCQGVIYVFVFRHREMLEMPNGFKFLQGLNFQAMATCHLNPLKVCLPVVAKTFASITRMHQLAFCYTIIERNKRSLIPVMGLGQSGPSRLTNLNPLDSFFPFDPYVLSRSHKFFSSLYQEYQGTPEVDEEEGKEEGKEDEDDFLPDVEQAQSFDMQHMSSSLQSPQSPTDFMNYGTSPGFKHF